jgi:DNA mismatch endonuclease (patch repair protein)
MRPLSKIKSRRLRQPLSRSEMMARIRSTETSPERAVRSALHVAGIRYRKNAGDLPGKPDIVNRSKQWAIFIHGCFWHSHPNCPLASSPKTNKQYWLPKLARTVNRDAEARERLRESGYLTFVIWECETRDPKRLDKRISEIFEEINQASVGTKRT